MAQGNPLQDIVEARRSGKRIVAVSCYDFTTARLVSQADVDMIIVGDSAAQLMLGFDSTLHATMDFMVTITAAVRRAAPGLCVVADMPFLSYQLDRTTAIRNAGRFVTDGGADLVKMEVCPAHIPTLKAIVDAGIAVMAHIGIRPQFIGAASRPKAEATTAEQAMALIRLAKELIEAGTSAILLEGIAAEVAGIITSNSPVPVIGCGSGPSCDGQVLIVADILGLTPRRPRFAAAFACLADGYIAGVSSYSRHVRDGTFPDQSHCYHMKPGQREILEQMLKSRGD